MWMCSGAWRRPLPRPISPRAALRTSTPISDELHQSGGTSGDLAEGADAAARAAGRRPAAVRAQGRRGRTISAPSATSLARRRVERASADGKVTASAEDLAVVERLIKNTNEAGPVLILGWYNYHQGNPARALEWFKPALDRNGAAKAAEGYAMSLRALERLGRGGFRL